MIHPSDVAVHSNVPFAETNLRNDKGQISSTPVSTVVSLKAVSTLQHYTSFCSHSWRTLESDSVSSSLLQKFIKDEVTELNATCPQKGSISFWIANDI